MKMFTQILAMLALVMLAVADFPHYADPGDKQCQVIAQWEEYSVIADCPVYQPDKIYLCSVLDLDKCYANENGGLVARQDGGFSSSCNDCYWNNTVMFCNCDINSTHVFMQPHVETNDLIVNANGAMLCFERGARECPPAAEAMVAAARHERLKEKKAFQA